MSKRASFTPGPWTLHEYVDSGIHVADVFDGYHECKTACLNIGDARLIAAAPDLLEALQDLLDDTQHREHDCGDAQCPVKRARGAVAKATGADHD